MPSKELIAELGEVLFQEEYGKDAGKVCYHRNYYERLAQAAISTILAALQEPTEGMIEAGCDQYDFGDQITQGEILAKEWRAMLKASALGEQAE